LPVKEKRLLTGVDRACAASGPENLIWPWGNEFEISRLAAAARDAQPVYSLVEGASSVGAYHMAGNMAEWVADAYRADSDAK
jgi:formylglycine-generating enzyme required for sulfatase activity